MPCLRMSVNRLREGMMIKEDVFFKDRGGDCARRSGRHEGRRRAADQTFCGQCDGGISDGRKERPEQQEQSAPAKTASGKSSRQSSRLPNSRFRKN